jgi:LL-diaminopimelate aminotransferase
MLYLLLTVMYSKRVESLPKYLFAELDELKNQALRAGKDVIDLGIGDPDLPTPPHIIKALYEAAKDPKTHGYPPYEGILPFREAVARWYKRVKGVSLDAEKEVIALIGSKEGIAHAPLAFINRGDIALVPDPGYPVYRNATALADGKHVAMPLTSENEFVPDIEKIAPSIAKKAALMFINYPNNPTAAIAGEDFFKHVIDFAEDNDIVVFHDYAYGDVTFDGYRAPSFLSVHGAKDVGVEFHSLSKTYNMTGWRIGFAVGNSDIIRGILKIKTNVDSGAFAAVQRAAIAALEGSQECVGKNIKTYEERRDAFLEGLDSLGLEYKKPKATFYVWASIPKGRPSVEYSRTLLEKAGIVATPGVGFGEHGEGYLRFALTKPVERIREAVKRMKEL